MIDQTDSAEREAIQTVALPRLSWRLHVLASPDRAWRGRILPLPQAGVRIGRRPESVTVAIGDSTLSREHLELLPLPDNSGVSLRDLGSHNGTRRGGQAVTHAQLGDGAVLRFGDSVAVLECDIGACSNFSEPTADVPGRSAAARKLRSELEAAAREGLPTLLVGATGAGKEFAARELHLRARRMGTLTRLPQLAVTGAEIQSAVFGADREPGLLQLARGGSLLIDGLDDLAIDCQTAILHAVDESTTPQVPSDQGILWIATATDSLDERVRDGVLRRDLRARFLSQRIHVPDLASRLPDLLEFADVLLPAPGGGPWTSVLLPDAVEALLLSPWPDNLWSLLATLRHLSRRYIGAQLGADALPERFEPASGPLAEPRAQADHAPDAEALRKLLQRYDGNIEKVATHFGRHRKQIYRWLARAGIGEPVLLDYRRGKVT